MEGECPKIAPITETTRQKIRNNSVASLPTDPSDRGMSAAALQERFVAPVLDGELSLYTEVNRVVTEANALAEYVGKLKAWIQETENALKAQAEAATAAIAECYSPERLPTGGTVENGNEFNPFKNYIGEVWINGDNGTGQRNQTVNIGDGAKGETATVHKLAKMRCAELSLYYRKVNDHIFPITPTAEEIAENRYDVGQVLIATSATNTSRPVGSIVYLERGNESYLWKTTATSAALPGTWISLSKFTAYSGTYVVFAQRIV